MDDVVTNPLFRSSGSSGYNSYQSYTSDSESEVQSLSEDESSDIEIAVVPSSNSSLGQRAVIVDPVVLKDGLYGDGVAKTAQLGYAALGSKRGLEMEKSETASKTQNQKKFDTHLQDLKDLLRLKRPMTFNLSSKVIDVEGDKVPYDITKPGEIRRLLEENYVKIISDEDYEKRVALCEKAKDKTDFYQSFVCESQIPLIMKELEEIREEMSGLFEEIHPSYGEAPRVSQSGIGVENGPKPFTFSSLGAQRFVSDHEKHLMEMFRDPTNGYVISSEQTYLPDKITLTSEGKKLLKQMAAARIARKNALDAVNFELKEKKRKHAELSQAAQLSGVSDPEIEKLEKVMSALQIKGNEIYHANFFAVDWMIVQLQDEVSFTDGDPSIDGGASITIRQSAQDWIDLDKPVQLEEGNNAIRKSPREWLANDDQEITCIIGGVSVTKTVEEWIENDDPLHDPKANEIRQKLHLDIEITTGFNDTSGGLDMTEKVAFKGSSTYKTLTEWLDVLDPNKPEDLEIIDWINNRTNNIQFTMRYKAYNLYCDLLKDYYQNVSSSKVRRRLAEKSSKDFNDKVRSLNAEPVSSWKFWQEEKARELTAQEQQEGFTLGSLFFYGMGDEARIANIAYHNDHKMRVARDADAENDIIEKARELNGSQLLTPFSNALDRADITVEEAFEALFSCGQ